ncbi:16S rRNA (guanine(527)-N(7))-methyltransferase RsmG [Candidatus Peregrinibacteria bacterium]|nr:16S rRNA (guanine(527)-N(7))-methyltransferase RsmG [Candidatus Peregrinibacteria bacterium]
MDRETEYRLQELQKTFLEENVKLNLSALRDEESCWIGNVLDSLPLLELDFAHREDAQILDIGTGGGFPLLPLAVCKPRWHCTGLDSTGKKLDAIRRIADALGLTNVDLLNGRAEELGHEPGHRESYDIVTARAVAPLSTLLELTVPFVRIDGHFVAWKSLHCEDELAESDAARKALGCTLIDRKTYDLGGTWGQRQLLIFRKTSATPSDFPRKTGIPKSEPIR